MNRLLILVGLALLLNSCTPSSGGTKAPSTRDVLTADEIATTGAITAYDAITLKRPNFLKSRGPKSVMGMHDERSTQYPSVYMNGMFYGGIEKLRDILVQDVKEIRYLDPASANLQFGLGNTAGAILVTTRR
jgi:hypothetical protein